MLIHFTLEGGNAVKDAYSASKELLADVQTILHFT